MYDVDKFQHLNIYIYILKKRHSPVILRLKPELECKEKGNDCGRGQSELLCDGYKLWGKDHGSD